MFHKIFQTMNLFLACYVLLSFCRFSFADEPLPVKTMPIEKKTVSSVITAFGSLEKKPQLLYFERSGYLTKLLVDEGQVVKKRQLLAQLDTIMIDNQKAQIQLALQHAKHKVARAKKLQRRNVLAQDELEDLEYNHSAKSLELENLNEERQKHFLYAPTRGRILQRFLDFAGPVDPTTPIFMLKSFKQPWLVTALLTEQEINTIKKGNIAKVYFDGLPKKVFTGRVQKIAESTENKEAMLEIEIALKTKVLPILRAGMKAKVHIETAKHQGYPVPVSILSRIQNNTATLFVVAKEQQIAKKLEVEFRFIKGTDAIVLTDLSQFDELIIVGQHNLKEGSLIQVIKED